MIAGSVPLQIVVWRLAAGERVSRADRCSPPSSASSGSRSSIGPDGLAGRRDRRRAPRDARRLDLVVARLVRRRGGSGSRRDPFVATVYEMLGGGLVLLAAGLAARRGWPSSTRTPSRRARRRVGLPRARGLGARRSRAYVWLLDNAPISQVVTHQYVNPLVAVALGALLLDERPGPTTARGRGADRRRGRRHRALRGPRGPTEPQPVATPRRASAARRGTRADPSG